MQIDPSSLTFIFYILAMVFIGFLGWRNTSDLSDYILGGRRLGAVVTALSAGASDMSGWLLMGLPGAVFLSGLSESWIAVGLIAGAWLNWYCVAGRLRIYTEYCDNAQTLPDFFASRFEDHSHILRLLSALVILVFFTLYCASGVVAGAKLFNSMFGMDYGIALWAAAAATILYVLIGGFLAVSWTDTVQASLMVTALVLAPLMIIYADGGVNNSLKIIEHANPKYLSWFESASSSETLNSIALISLLAWGLGYFGQPHILVRFMAADATTSMKSARRIGMTWMIICLIGAIAVGFFAIAYAQSHPDFSPAKPGNHEKVFIVLAEQLFNPWIAGMLLAAVLAAIMSTLSCQLLVCSSALTRDIYHVFLRRNASSRELVVVGRVMVLVVSVIAIALAQDPESSVLKMVGYAWAGFGAAFGPVILLSLFWPRMTRNGALAGMLVGAVTIVVWKQGGYWGLYEIVPGFLASALAIVVASLLSPPPSKAMLATFEKVNTKVHAR